MENSGYTAISRKLRHAAEERFKKEGVARFTSVNCMNVLTYSVQHEITRNLLQHEVQLQAQHLHRHIDYAPDVVTFLIGNGFSPDLGARNIRNCVEYHVGEALRPLLLATATPSCGTATVCGGLMDRWSDALTISVEGQALSASPLSRHPALARALGGEVERAPVSARSAPGKFFASVT